MTDAFDKGSAAINRADEQRNPAPPGSKFEAIQRMEEIAMLGDSGLKITGVKISGRGPGAIVDLLLGGGNFIRFDRYDLMLRPSTLEAAIVTHTGIATRDLSKAKAIEFASCAFKVAQHNFTDDLEETARSWGVRYLALVQMRNIENLSDTRERRRVFSNLFLGDARPSQGGMAPGPLPHADYQQVVLLDRSTRYRYVYRNWFRAWVKAEERNVPDNLATRMLHVGWEQNGRSGYIGVSSRFGGDVRAAWAA